MEGTEEIMGKRPLIHSSPFYSLLSVISPGLRASVVNGTTASRGAYAR